MAEMEPNEVTDPQETLVREYLSTQLDGQVGRAEARFRLFLAQQEPAAPRQKMFRMPIRFGRWTLGVAGGALAASLAALWASPAFRPVTPGAPGPASPGAAPPVTDPILVQQDVQSQTFDDGTVMVDGNTPVRILRRHDVERTRWYDQHQNLQHEQLVPQDHVIYVQLKTY